MRGVQTYIPAATGGSAGGGYDAIAYQMIKTAVSAAAITASWELADRREVFDRLVFNLTAETIAGATSEAAFDSSADSLALASSVTMRDLINADEYLSALAVASDELSGYFLPGGGAINGYSYASKSKVVSSETASPTGVHFKSDGSKMYVASTNPDSVFQYTLSTPWDVSTASYDSVTLSVGTEESAPSDIFMSYDGTKLYVGGGGSDTIYQYTLSTAWDLSTASYDSVSLSVASNETVLTGFVFSYEGDQLYIVGTNSDAIYQYTLSTPWDLSTASYAEKEVSVATQITVPAGIWVSTDGTAAYVTGSGQVYQYNMSTPGDISTATYASLALSVNAQDGSPEGLFFPLAGDALYVVATTNNAVYQYSGTPFSPGKLVAPQS